MRIRRGTRVPRDDGKRVEELVGRVHTDTRSLSLARMLAPPGWTEGWQTAAFDEAVYVLRGVLTVRGGPRPERLAPGEVGLYLRGQRLQYANEGEVACEYLSTCAPAFAPRLARVEPLSRPERNVVTLSAAHPKAAALSREVKRTAAAFLRRLEVRNGELSLALVGDSAIRRLNRTWRQQDRPTDVLSFPAGEPPPGTPGPRPLGDVIISLDTAARAASREGSTLRQEVRLYLAHGLLHLLGHDHQRPAQARTMASLERRLLEEEGMLGRAGEGAPARARGGRGARR